MKKTLSVLLSAVFALAVAVVPLTANADAEPIYLGEMADLGTASVNVEQPGGVYYFTFKPLTSGTYAFFSTTPDYDTIGSILDSDGNELARNDDGVSYGGNSRNFFVYYDFEAQKTYRLQCKMYDGSTSGSFDVRLLSQNLIAKGILNPEEELPLTIPMNTIFTYTFTPQDAGNYYFLLNGTDALSLELYNSDNYRMDGMVGKTGYVTRELAAGVTYTVKIHGAGNNDVNTLSVFKEVLVDDGSIYTSVPKEINFTAPYERHIVHFVPEVDSLYNYEIAGGQISYDFFRYVDEDGDYQYPGKDGNNYILHKDAEYILSVYLFSDYVSGSGTVTITDKLHRHNNLALSSAELVEIANPYDVHQYSFTPETSGVYCLTASPEGEEYVDTWASIYDSDIKQLQYDDDGNAPHFKLEYYLEAGKTYYYRVRSYSSGTGKFNIILENTDDTHEHIFQNKVIAPTCTEGGYTEHKCVCGYIYSDNFTDPNGHSLNHYTLVSPTCEGTGTEHYYCVNCSYECDEEIPAEGHTLNHYTTVSPTCEGTGTEYYYCVNCSYAYDEEIPAKGHAFEEVGRTEPTCTEAGAVSYYCDGCGQHKEEQLDALGHSFTNYTYNNDATIERDGTETAKCDRCDATDTRTKAGTKLNPTGGAVLKTGQSRTVDYRSKVTITAAADNVPSGYFLAVYEGNNQVAKGDNARVSYSAGEVKNNRTFTVKVVDSNGTVQKSDSETLQKDVEVKVNSGFFAKIIAFFRGLFGSLPEVEIKP